MRFILPCLAATALSTAAIAQQPAPKQDHIAHHPDGASGPAASAKKPPVDAKAHATRSKAPPAAGSGSTGMGMSQNMGKMHDRAHKPGGMHDRMHGKDGKMTGGDSMHSMPASSAGK